MDKRYGIVALCVITLSLAFTFITISLTGKTSQNDEVSVQENVGDAVTLQAQEGTYSVKITTVFDAEPEPKESNAPKAEKVAIVVYEYTNDDIAHGLAIGNTHFKAFDSKGRELEQYPQSNMFEPGEVGASGTFTASVAFALNSDEKYLKIEYYNDISSKNPDAVFEKTW